MSDIIDDAQDHMERENEARLKALRETPTVKYTPTGQCYYCGGNVPADNLYCNDDCADDYAYLLARQKQNVKVL